MKRAVLGLGSVGLLWLVGCSAGADPAQTGPGSGSSTESGGNGGGGGGDARCPSCDGTVYTDCEGEQTDCADQDLVCTRDLGCVACAPGNDRCVDGGTVAVEECKEDGSGYEVVENCGAGTTCSNGRCRTACEAAEDQPSNVGCEFWAVDLDQQDGGGNDPASEPWGLALSNVGDDPAEVVIEINTADPGAPAEISTALSITVQPGTLEQVTLPTRELDCGIAPNDYDSPGTCLSSKAFRVRSTSPIVVTQFNVFENSYSNDASLLIPTSTLGQTYRVIGWNAGHPVAIDIGLPIEIGVDRSYVTIVGTADGTNVTVKPSWRIKGNGSIPATAAGGTITATINAFDVLNLETDDGTTSDDLATIADLSGTGVYADKPVAVFTGVESTSVPGSVEIPTYAGWDDGKSGGDSCCLDHLEEQLFPVESAGTNYVVTRSPLRSSGWRDPDVIRFVGGAEVANVTTTLPAPWNAFTLQPGEVRTTWAQDNFTATADKPFLLGQLLTSQGYTTSYIGDPALTVFPPAEQQRSEYIILTPSSWTSNWVVIAAEVGSSVTIDGAAPSGCLTESAGTVLDVTYESRVCPLTEGTHALSGDKPFQIIAYGYGSAGSYAFVGGADVKKIYEPPPPPN
jgi:hypothetical protein